jgi:MarR family transcriptional regulator, transcriptional regulator for hemolysin
VVAGAEAEHDVDLMLLLGQASHALTTELTAGLATLGITPRAHCVLYHAAQGDLTQSQLAALCALDKTTMVFTLDELEQSGLAERRLSPTDRRARIIAVTEAGRKLVAEADAVVDRIYEDVLGALPRDERDAFLHALDRLVAGRLSQPVQCERPVRRPRQSSWRAAV